MTGESFEYAIKKDVRNNPIVREVDRERQREMWRSVAVSVFLVCVLVFSVWRQIELRQYGRAVNNIQNDRAIEESINRQLRLDIEALQNLSRIESKARELHMIPASGDDDEVIELGISASPPPGSVVALK